MTRSKIEISRDYDRIFLEYGLRDELHYYRYIISLLGEVKDKTLLDIACGEGILLEEAKKRGVFKTCGVDISLEALKKARRNSPSSYFILSDGEKIALDSKFDYVTCLGSLEHYESPEVGCKEIHRLLKEDGRAIVLLPNQFAMHIILDVLFTGRPGTAAVQVIERLASFNEWKDFLEQNGLKVLKAYKYNQKPIIFKDGRLRSIKKFLRNILLYYIVPFYFARNFIFLCEKKK